MLNTVQTLIRLWKRRAPDVVYPAVDGVGHQQLQVEPQSEEVFCLLVADVVDDAGFIQFRLQLVPQIPWDCNKQHAESPHKLTKESAENVLNHKNTSNRLEDQMADLLSDKIFF